MTSELKYQLRVLLGDDFADLARGGMPAPELAPLNGVLSRHDASLKSQYDAFAEYVRLAEEGDRDEFPLYEWTKATIENPVKEAKYKKVFTIYASGAEVYSKSIADTLEAELASLVGGPVVRKLTRHDTDPANNPQPPKRYRSARGNPPTA